MVIPAELSKSPKPKTVYTPLKWDITATVDSRGATCRASDGAKTVITLFYINMLQVLTGMNSRNLDAQEQHTNAILGLNLPTMTNSTLYK